MDLLWFAKAEQCSFSRFAVIMCLIPVALRTAQPELAISSPFCLRFQSHN